MGLSTVVPGDPASCRETVAGLKRLARRSADAEDLLQAQASLPDEEFSGRTAVSYRSHCRSRGDSARALETDASGVADGLDAYATTLDDVQRVMARARAKAQLHGILVDGVIEEPTGGGVAHKAAAYSALERIVGDARGVLQSAEDSLRAALAQHAGGPPHFALAEDSPTMLAPPFPPPEAAWPADPWEPGDDRSPDMGHHEQERDQEEPRDRERPVGPDRPEGEPDAGPPTPSPSPSTPDAAPAVLTPEPGAPPTPLPDPLRPLLPAGWTCVLPTADEEVPA